VLVARIDHVELEGEPDFFERYVDGLRLAPMGGQSALDVA
jgi:hypothetical protein